MEGISKDIIRIIQQLRKETNFYTLNKISIAIRSNNIFLSTVIKNFMHFIKYETLSIKIFEEIYYPVSLKYLVISGDIIYIKMVSYIL